MVRVTVELCPGGDESKPRHLGTARIANRRVTGDLADYTVTLSKWGDPKARWKSGAVLGFNRVTRGPWDLLGAAIAACLGTRLAGCRVVQLDDLAPPEEA